MYHSTLATCTQTSVAGNDDALTLVRCHLIACYMQVALSNQTAKKKKKSMSQWIIKKQKTRFMYHTILPECFPHLCLGYYLNIHTTVLLCTWPPTVVLYLCLSIKISFSTTPLQVYTISLCILSYSS